MKSSSWEIFDCVRCGSQRTCSQVRFFGGAVARICDSCETEWNRYCRSRKLWQEQIKTDTILEILQSQLKGNRNFVSASEFEAFVEKLENAYQILNEINLKFHDLATEWIAAGTKNGKE